MSRVPPIHELLATMSEEELHQALRRTAECDRTIDAEWLASINDDRAEARAALEETMAALEVLERKSQQSWLKRLQSGIRFKSTPLRLSIGIAGAAALVVFLSLYWLFHQRGVSGSPAVTSGPPFQRDPFIPSEPAGFRREPELEAKRPPSEPYVPPPEGVARALAEYLRDRRTSASFYISLHELLDLEIRVTDPRRPIANEAAWVTRGQDGVVDDQGRIYSVRVLLLRTGPTRWSYRALIQSEGRPAEVVAAGSFRALGDMHSLEVANRTESESPHGSFSALGRVKSRLIPTVSMNHQVKLQDGTVATVSIFVSPELKFVDKPR